MKEIFPQNAFTNLGELITTLMEFMKAKKNVHHSIKEQVRKIRFTYNEANDVICLFKYLSI